ncbi:MAG: hypothetical protein JWP12_1661 [Bacteroidetes bacterium]|nr:hypothetical protein [Bacteroidota bacterium]
MKSQALFIGFLFIGLAAKAQDGVEKIQVTDELRQKFALEAKAPDPSQIVYITPPELLKKSNPVLLQPDPSQIVTETPPSLRKKTLSLQQTGDPQNVSGTPPASSTPKK